jgi:hypothetical protein
MRRALVVIAVLVLQACASTPPQGAGMPPLRLAPAEAGQSLALAQRLTIDARGRTQTVEAMLELNESKLELALLRFGQPVARLSWDGRELTQQRVAALPPEVSAERILADLQFVMWPVESLSRALPAPWHISQHGDVRELSNDAEVVARVRYRARWDAELENLREGYRLRIESVPLAD